MTFLYFCLGLALATPSDDYVKSVATWRESREKRLRDHEGYLALVSLAWLNEGLNTIGSAPNAIVKLPKGFPARVGHYLVKEKEVTLVPEPGVEILVDQKKISEATKIEWNGARASDIRVGRLKLSVARRNRGDGPRGRVYDPESPTLKTFKGVSWYKVDPAYRVQAKFQKLAAPEATFVPNSIGTENDITLVGSLTFKLKGVDLTLKAHEGDDGKLFVIFRDPTNGSSTYSAGRYLTSEVPRPDGAVVLDFNLAYSPPCAFNKFTTCPYVPENKIPIAVEAGEQFRKP